MIEVPQKAETYLHYVLAISLLEYILRRNEMDKEMRLICKAVPRTSMLTTAKYSEFTFEWSNTKIEKEDIL